MFAVVREQTNSVFPPKTLKILQRIHRKKSRSNIWHYFLSGTRLYPRHDPLKTLSVRYSSFFTFSFKPVRECLQMVETRCEYSISQKNKIKSNTTITNSLRLTGRNYAKEKRYEEAVNEFV